MFVVCQHQAIIWTSTEYHQYERCLCIKRNGISKYVKDNMQLHLLQNGPFMMTSSNWKIFRVTGHLCGEFTGLRWIPRPLMFYLICAWINGWANNGEVGDLGRYRPHYDVIVVVPGRKKLFKRDFLWECNATNGCCKTPTTAEASQWMLMVWRLVRPGHLQPWWRPESRQPSIVSEIHWWPVCYLHQNPTMWIITMTSQWV